MPFINECFYDDPEVMQKFKQEDYPKLRQAFPSLGPTLQKGGRTVNYEEDAYLIWIETPHRQEVFYWTFAFYHQGSVLTVTADKIEVNVRDYPEKTRYELPLHWQISRIQGLENLSDLVHTLQLLKQAFIVYGGGGGYGADPINPTTVSLPCYPGHKYEAEFKQVFGSV